VVRVDTNVVVRLLVGDDPAQTRKAERAFLAHARNDGVYVSLVVLAEVGWVLSSAYEWDRATLHARISQLIRTRGIVVEELELVQRALDDFHQGKADFSDYLILGKARESGGPLLTFDRKLSRETDARLL